MILKSRKILTILKMNYNNSQLRSLCCVYNASNEINGERRKIIIHSYFFYNEIEVNTDTEFT